MQLSSDVTKYQRIDHYWRKIDTILDSNGRKKYPQLFVLAKCVLTQSHGNSAPEGGFSINKFLLDHNGSSIKEETTVALSIVKDELCRVGGIFKFSINGDLISSVKSARSKYVADLEAKKEIEEKQKIIIKSKRKMINIQKTRKRKYLTSSF